MSQCKEKEIRYWTSHSNKSAAWWYHNLGLDSERFKLIYDKFSPDYLFATEHIFTEWRERIDFKRLYSSKRVVLFWAGECISPDMNIFDYATTFDRDVAFSDRVIRRPVVSFFGSFNEEPLNKRREITDLHLREKVRFCNFIYSNPLAHPCRDALFYAISKYKHVDSLGSHLKNCDSQDSRSAADFEAKSVEMKRPYKFSIAAENARYRGYTSEKIITSFLARTIPIYWGDPYVELEFNPKAFINANNLDEKSLLETVRAIDSDKNLWKEMISQPPMTEEQHDQMLREEARYRQFMEEIFSKPLKSVMRKPQGFWPDNYRRAFFGSKACPVGNSSFMSRLASSCIQTIM